jgi:hypothetical protein
LRASLVSTALRALSAFQFLILADWLTSDSRRLERAEVLKAEAKPERADMLIC